MAVFPISFTYRAVDYTASVQKEESFSNSPVQYNVREIKPELNIHSGIYLVNTNRDGFVWTPDPIHPELPSIMATAIKEGCLKVSISIFS